MQLTTVKEMRTLGWAPFRKAEIQVSMRKKIARLVLLMPDREENHPTIDFPIIEGTANYEQAGREIIAAAGSRGLLDANSMTVIVDVDSGKISA